MRKQFNKDNLEKLGIFELRNIAREVGVYSPTIHKKETLIEDIVLIMDGKKEPHVSKNKQGRPPKSISGVNNILDIFIPKNIVEKQEKKYNDMPYDISALSKLTAKESTSPSMQYQADEQKIIKGIVEVSEEGYAFCYEKGYSTTVLEQNFFIANNIVAGFNLKSGDVIEAYVKKIADDKPYIVYKIEKINSTPINQFQINRVDFNELMAEYPTQKLLFDIKQKTINHLYLENYLPIGKGQRSIVLMDKSTDYSAIIVHLLNSLQKNENLIKQCVLIDERPEDINEYYHLLKDAKIVHTSVQDEPHQALQKFELSVERAKRSVEENKDVVLLISNLLKLQNLYRKKFIMTHSGLENQDKIYSISMIKKLLSNAIATKNSGSLTIIALVEKSIDEDLNYELRELCNMCVVLNEKTYLKQNKIWFDVLNSKTRKAHLLLTEEENENLNSFLNDVTIDNVQEKTLALENKLLNELK